MLDLSESRVRQVVFSWFKTVNKGGFNEKGLWGMTDGFLRHLQDVEWEQRIDRGEATLDDWMKADA